MTRYEREWIVCVDELYVSVPSKEWTSDLQEAFGYDTKREACTVASRWLWTGKASVSRRIELMKRETER